MVAAFKCSAASAQRSRTPDLTGDGIRSRVLSVFNGSLEGGSAHVGSIQPFDGSTTTSQALSRRSGHIGTRSNELRRAVKAAMAPGRLCTSTGVLLCSGGKQRSLICMFPSWLGDGSDRADVS